MTPSINKSLRRFRHSVSGNVTMIFALTAPFLCFAVAMAVDYNNATVIRSKLNAAADAAALAALTPKMMGQPDTPTAHDAAVAMFNARAATIGLIANATATPVFTHPSGQTSRQVVINYTAQYNTIFSGWLKQNTMTVSGTSTAVASYPPNIDFYLLLDNSPSMSLPADATGITAMQSLTKTQDGGNACAFACHQASTSNSANPVSTTTDTMGNPCTDGTPAPYPQCTQSSGVGKGSIALNNQFCNPDPYCSNSVAKNFTTFTPKPQMDNYALARANNITLRLDELSTGVTTLMQTAVQNQTSGLWPTPPVYQFAAYQIDSLWTTAPTNTLLMNLTKNFQSNWSTASQNFGVMEMFSNSYGCLTSACTAGVYNNDQTTNYDNAMNDININMPVPGNGTNVQGDKPQEVLFFVTDGVEDELNINRLIQPINGNSATNYCSIIKARGIKIAVLYTTYLPVTSNNFYNQNVAPFQSTIGTALFNCASTGLYYEAAIGSNLGDGLKQLFQTVLAQSAALSN